MASQSGQVKIFVADALDVVEFKLIREAKDAEDTEIFHPEMAHQIFGQEESIFGYKDLKIQLYFSAGPLDIYFNTEYSKKIDDLCIDDLKADDIRSAVEEILPGGACFTNYDEFLRVSEKKNSEFRPIGDKQSSFQVTVEGEDTRTFEIYSCDMSTPNFLKYHAKFETFIFWFIDAASKIQHDPQWQYFLVFEKYKASTGEDRYASVGFASVYQCYSYPEHIRPRISQMLVLPPFQRLGVASKIIETIYAYYAPRKDVKDITVEEPSAIFQHIRSIVDVKLCRKLAAFAPEKLKNGLNKEMLGEAKENFKINPKQCRTVYEILRLGVTDRNNVEDYKNYRVEVKKRLNMVHHKSKRDLERAQKRGFNVTAALKLLSTDEERMEQLQFEYQATEEAYLSILKKANEEA